jgi:hypothetical protein
MKQITRDLYTSGRVWLSLSHSFSIKQEDGKEIELFKNKGDFVTLNAGALFVLSLWATGSRTPKKFYIPEYKIEEFRLILSELYKIKSDEAYVRDEELTDIAKPAKLYYKMTGSTSSIKIYLVENNFNGDKSINVAIELTDKAEVKAYSMYNSNVADLIDIIPTAAEIVKYKQSAAELCYIHSLLSGKGGSTTFDAFKTEQPVESEEDKESEPRTVTKVDRTHVGSTRPENKKPVTEEVVAVASGKGPKSEFDYNQLLQDE